MSVDAITSVFRHSKSTQTSRNVIVVLADRADEYGLCWPSISNIAKRANCSKRTAQYALRNLEEAGEVAVVAGQNGGGRQPRLYRVTLPGLDGDLPKDHLYFQMYGKDSDQPTTEGVQTLHPTDNREVQELHPSPESGVQPVAARGATDRQEGCNPSTVGVQRVAPEPSVTTKEPKENRHVGDGDAATDATLSNLLADLIEQNTGRRPPIGKKWIDAERLMLDRDKRDPDQAERLLRWSQKHEFWRSVILSMPKFREHYDEMLLQARRGQKQRKRGRAVIAITGDQNRGQHEKDLAWAAEHIPDLPAALVASAMGTVRLAKADITIENVRGRLAATGRIPAAETKVAA